ncbi:hypothetical protein [Hansschlegelia plantiphila]|uniref:Uncharacterized protein n=1 Tax=Hansschlegelia plantiphila TaxID=374655 RepID=A0A9W6MV38_9HYPH|nr:hypothetical protein [Hansschlegelia plantiphila]GLK67330.1 hypothetical protein GCM10008179_09680 [Hansschlegelia plantiphila]
MKLAVLDGGAFYHHATIYGPRYRDLFDRPIYMRDLTPDDLTDVGVLIVPDRINPDVLRAKKDVLTNFLDRGRTLIALGENQVETWLPGVGWSPRPTNFWWWLDENAEPEQRLVEPAHELFVAVPFADAIWHYHGVLTPPAGARTLIDVPADPEGRDEGGALLYDDQASFAGRAIVSTLDPFYHHGSSFMPATTRFLDGFLPWAQRLASAVSEIPGAGAEDELA